MLHILWLIVEWIVITLIAAFAMLYLARLKGDFDDYIDARVDAKLKKWERENRDRFPHDR